jgi:hypothetical protein
MKEADVVLGKDMQQTQIRTEVKAKLAKQVRVPRTKTKKAVTKPAVGSKW